MMFFTNSFMFFSGLIINHQFSDNIECCDLLENESESESDPTVPTIQEEEHHGFLLTMSSLILNKKIELTYSSPELDWENVHRQISTPPPEHPQS